MTHKTSKPLTLVIFGATGDLYQNKLSEALFDLFSGGLLPSAFTVLGFSRMALTDEEFRNFTREAILKKNASADKRKLDIFLKRFIYMKGDLGTLADFHLISERLALRDEEFGVCSNKLFYLAVPPTHYKGIFQHISAAGLTIPCASVGVKKDEEWTRVLVEKPFAESLEEAGKLDTLLGELFDESQIFRIDHYLAKETLQNILAFRFSNAVFESIWNKENIEKIRIIFHEKNTVATRGDFYNRTGALRDVGQNHMLQMLALVAMEDPAGTDAANIREARSAILEKTVLLDPEAKGSLIRGQYDGYLKEPLVPEGSTTETFFRLCLGINNDRWRGVRFELESGKALSESSVSIEVIFKGKHKNKLTFAIQPDDGIRFRFWFKRPGFDQILDPQDLSFSYLHDSKEGEKRDAYERVLYDCIRGDQTLFAGTREITAEWKLITHAIVSWQRVPLTVYPKGSEGKNIH